MDEQAQLYLRVALFSLLTQIDKNIKSHVHIVDFLY